MSKEVSKILLSFTSVFVNGDGTLTLNCYTSNPHNFMGTPYSETIPIGELDYRGIISRLKEGYHKKYNKTKFEFNEDKYEIDKVIFEFTFKPLNLENSKSLEEVFKNIKGTCNV